MAELSFFVGVIGNVISVLMFLSPVGTFWRIIKKKSTEEFESFPYVCTWLNSSLWTYYGVIKPGAYLVATVNSFGVVVQSFFLGVFLIYAPSAMKAKTGIMVGILDIGFFATAIVVSQLVLDGETRIGALGFVCAGLNIIMYGSPLSVMKTVIKNRSVEYMPFMLSFFFFLNGGIWTFYAFLLSDWFLAVPNGIGLGLGLAQIAIYGVYRNAKPLPLKTSIRTQQEQDSQTQPLISSSNPEP
ncbi:bidirectional sugar transporter SWEET17-like [Cucurbita pepo subsp. pepo]|uniref:bidirectional sugar transporter SWEET17-like n=2 Tax=Cucurbita pepo subsp. pepo TaxID=3664 RepID=UPI000C9D5013|nr:bidirectional sugar transporter SWEET17-like [Cucurbita pepo subsp. pepo]